MLATTDSLAMRHATNIIRLSGLTPTPADVAQVAVDLVARLESLYDQGPPDASRGLIEVGDDQRTFWLQCRSACSPRYRARVSRGAYSLVLHWERQP